MPILLHSMVLVKMVWEQELCSFTFVALTDPDTHQIARIELSVQGRTRIIWSRCFVCSRFFLAQSHESIHVTNIVHDITREVFGIHAHIQSFCNLWWQNTSTSSPKILHVPVIYVVKYLQSLILVSSKQTPYFLIVNLQVGNSYQKAVEVNI